LLAQMSEKAGVEHFGQEIRESAEEKAERIVLEELKRLGWTKQTPGRQRKGAPKKVQIALRLRRETTMTLAWIAQRLQWEPKHICRICFIGKAGIAADKVVNTKNRPLFRPCSLSSILMLKQFSFLVTVIGVVGLIACTKAPSSNIAKKKMLQRMENFYSFLIPTNITDLKVASQRFRNQLERSDNILTLIHFSANDAQVEEFMLSFSNRVTLLDKWKPEKQQELSKLAPWWNPEIYVSCDFFRLTKQSQKADGALQAYITATPSNHLIFMSSTVVER
jgi:hypothetical protein